jgi:LPS O-antigen subunit length determinant protein (WzzB/FepE family)
MNPKNQTLPDEEIDLRIIILTLWKEKFLIFIITLIFAVAGYIYSANQSKVYQITITLRQAPDVLFLKYKMLLEYEYEDTKKKQAFIDFASNFNQEFNLNLISYDEMLNFIEEKKKIDEFKSYIKKNNVNITNFIEGKFITKIDKVKIIPDTYIFNFSEPLSGQKFLNDYVLHIKKKTEKIFVEQLTSVILDKLVVANQSLDLKAKSEEKLLLELLLNQTKDLSLKYDPIRGDVSSEYLISKSPFQFVVIGLMIGMFFSIMIVFIRRTLK